MDYRTFGRPSPDHPTTVDSAQADAPDAPDAPVVQAVDEPAAQAVAEVTGNGN